MRFNSSCAFRRVLVLIPVLGALLSASSRAQKVLDARIHHLRSGAEREWTDFPENAEGPSLLLHFNSRRNSAEQTLRLRHRDLKQTWRLGINGRQVAQLPQDENERVTYWAVPTGVLRDGDNELRIDCTGGPSDDVLVGDIAMLDAPRAKVISEATVEVSVTDADGGTPLPCRITVADEDGALVDLGNRSDAHLAVRPGVVYTSDGQATLALPTGRYAIYAGRGFAYSIDSTSLDLRPGEIAKKSLRIRKAVPLGGYVSCDTHIHTFTYSRHGDATIEERMITLTGEGIELPVATDHNLQIDYDAPARKMHVRKFFTPVIGNEVTTASLGHFCVFPFVKGAHLVNWRVHSWAALSRDITNIAPDPVILLNHARDVHGNFRPFDPSRVAIATGPGINKPFWPTAKPYQPTSPQFSGYVLGSTGPVWIDVEGSGQFRSAYQYATDVVNATNGDLAAVVARLADDDEATAAQAASLLRARDPRDFTRRVRDATRSAAPAVRRGFDMFLAEWAKTRSAKSTARP